MKKTLLLSTTMLLAATLAQAGNKPQTGTIISENSVPCGAKQEKKKESVDLLCQDVESESLCLATNCAFGGPGFDQLLVANLGVQHLSVLDLNVKGQPLWTHRRP